MALVRIKEIGRNARCGKEMSGVPDLASSCCVLHAVDILNALPTKANLTDGTTDVTGFSNVTASPCVHLGNAGHFKSKGHVVWDQKRRRKLIVPEISRNIWNYFPMRSGQALVGSTYVC